MLDRDITSTEDFHQSDKEKIQETLFNGIINEEILTMWNFHRSIYNQINSLLGEPTGQLITEGTLASALSIFNYAIKYSQDVKTIQDDNERKKVAQEYIDLLNSNGNMLATLNKALRRSDLGEKITIDLELMELVQAWKETFSNFANLLT